MRKRWERFKAWVADKWRRFKKWIMGVLASLGLVSIAVVQGVDVTYTAATEYEDGTPLPVEEIAETRLYCNGELVASEPGADGAFEGVQALLPVGANQCYGTHVATNAKESQPSNTITVVVLTSSAPNPPVLIE